MATDIRSDSLCYRFTYHDSETLKRKTLDIEGESFDSIQEHFFFYLRTYRKETVFPVTIRTVKKIEKP